MKKFFTLLFLVLIAAGVSAAFIPVTNWVYASGYVMTARESEVRSPLQGAIKSWYVDDGVAVKKGQPLIQLECEVQQAALENAKNELDVVTARLKSLEISYKLEKSSMEEQKYRAERNLQQVEKEKKLIDADTVGAVSRKERDDAKLKVDLAKSQLSELNLPKEELLRKQIEITREQIEAAKAKVLLQEAELKLRTIHASQDGIVYFNRYDPGEVVTPDEVLGQVFDTSQWVVRLKLNEQDLKDVKLGQKVKVELAGFNSWVHGYAMATVCKITPVVSPQATGDGVFLVKAKMDDPTDKRLHPGMSATAKIDAGKISLLYRILGI